MIIVVDFYLQNKWRGVRKLELLKEILSDPSVKVDKQRIKFMQEWLQDEIRKETTIQKHGYRGYYTEKVKAFGKFLQSYGYAVYIAIMLFILAVLIFQLSAGAFVSRVTGLAWLPGVSFLLTALEAIGLIYYIFCKTHHRKWNAAAGIVGLLVLKQIWHLLHGSMEVSADMALFLMLFLAVHHYERYKQAFAEKSENLKQWLQDGAFADDTIMQLYDTLEQVRLEGGRQISRRKRDDEVDEMLLYLNWRRQDADAEAILEEIRTDAIAETYEGLVLTQPSETEHSETTEQIEQTGQNEPLSRKNARERLTMPILYMMLFPVFFLAVHWFFTAGKADTTQGGMLICAAVIAVLIVLVIAAFGQQEKNPRRKFWLELIPTLGLELMLVTDVYFLISGYYMERGFRSIKSILLFLCVGIPWFLSYAGKTQRNWKRMIAQNRMER